MENFDIIVVGSGYAGSIIARELANNNKKVLIIEKRNHIGGNMYDYFDKETNILVHKYGPHIGHYPDDFTFNYLKQFSEFVPYFHKVLVKTKNKKYFYIPFNLNSLNLVFSEKDSKEIKEYLLDNFKEKTTLMELKKHYKLKKLYNFLYINVFRDYTKKMWGLSPEELDPLVTNRIPIRLDYNDNHFSDPIQAQPKNGYTILFKNLLNHKNIKVILNENGTDFIKLKNNKIYFNNNVFTSPVIWTGSIDELFNFKYGKLPYRSLFFKINTFSKDSYQNNATINFPYKVKKTRTTEMKKINVQKNIENKTITLTEYPGEYNSEDSKFNDRFYPIINDLNLLNYNKYLIEAKKVENLFLCGRLAEYKYYDMEKIIKVALNKSKEILEKIK